MSILKELEEKAEKERLVNKNRVHKNIDSNKVIGTAIDRYLRAIPRFYFILFALLIFLIFYFSITNFI